MNEVIDTPIKNALFEKQSNDICCRDVRDGGVSLEFAPHLHYHVELIFVTDGECPCTVDSVEYTLTAGDVLAVFPNKVHSYGAGTGEKYMLIIANPDVFPELQSVFSVKTPASAIIHTDCDREKIYKLFASVCEISKSENPLSYFTEKGYLAALLGELISKMQFSGCNTDDSKALKTIVSFCTHNFTGDLSLEVLEKNLHLSKYYISHIFSNRLGTSFNDLINSLRISEACRLLRADDMSITQISEAVGFATQRTFNRAFLKYIGITPSEFRALRKDVPGVTLPH